jgi:hypothetical protein
LHRRTQSCISRTTTHTCTCSDAATGDACAQLPGVRHVAAGADVAVDVVAAKQLPGVWWTQGMPTPAVSSVRAVRVVVHHQRLTPLPLCARALLRALQLPDSDWGVRAVRAAVLAYG